MSTAEADQVDHTHDEHSGHAEHGGHADHAEMFRIAFWRNLALAVPVLVFSTQIQEWFNYDWTFPGSQWIAPVFGTIIYFSGGRPFLTGGIQEARDRQPGMMLLIALAITVAFVSSVVSLTDALDLEFWWELASLIVIMLLGHWQEMKAIGQAQGALAALAELLPDEAERITDSGDVETVALGDLVVGDRLLIRSGSRIPADGTIIDGSVEVDESMLTGESNPVTKTDGDDVVAGSVATDNSIRIEVTAIGDDTALGGIQRLVADAQGSKSRAQALADRAAAVLFYVAITSAIVTAVVWLALGEPDDALVRTITVLIIACPHALGLAIPLVISLSTAKAAQNGILVKDRIALEKMRIVDTVLFDKTGTLTAGEHVVADLATVDGDTDRMLALAAGVEADSEHPLARAIVTKALDEGIDAADATDFRSMTGRGVAATVEGHEVAIGGPSLLRELDLTPPAELDDKISGWESRGAAVLHIVVDGEVVGSFALEDGIRTESRQAVDALHDRDIRVVMITGDSQAVADSVAAELGIDDVYAEVLPDDKDAAVKELQGQGRTVAMVGDGVNDAPALARADVGLAIGAGTDVAIESAGVVLASSDPRNVLGVITLSHASYRKMIQNLVWAAGYNIVAIPLAAGVLAPIGFVLPPAFGAALMSLSTIVVAANAQLLRRLDLSPDAL
ncbi:copper-translocating P-type ATPase [Ilumatobacter sp.]|uniref:copper-translocating P-type ATPase n=1 Tax=Ilumatobacter sp. TaxID=1967498 RepID=UPI003C603059